MTNIRAVDTLFFDELFEMGGRYVYNFSERTFVQFFAEKLSSSKPRPNVSGHICKSIYQLVVRGVVHGSSQAPELQYFRGSPRFFNYRVDFRFIIVYLRNRMKTSPGQFTSQRLETAVPRPVGRPRSLTLNDILDTVIELGLTRLNIQEVAAKLGVGTATIYNYVKSRDELLRLAAVAQASRPHLDDLGEHWSDLVRSFADGLFEMCSAEPQLIIQGMHGAMGPEIQLDALESFLAAMARRGWIISESYRIFSSVNNIVIGAVVRSAYVRAMQASGRSHADAVRRSLAERRLEELPNVRACEEFADEARAFSFHEILERIIQSFANDRGEKFLKRATHVTLP
jgi:AcrR family transcriptional regulator